MAELKAQTGTVATFSWGNVRITDWAWREEIVLDDATGTGDSYNEKSVEGRRSRMFSFAGIIIDGSPPFATVDGTVKVDLTGDNSKTLTGSFKRRLLEFGMRKTKGAYWVRGVLKLNGVLTLNGVAI